MTMHGKNYSKTGKAGVGRRPRRGLDVKTQVSVSEQEKRQIEEAAAALGISTSRFVAQAALREAQIVLSARRGLIASSEGLQAKHHEILQLVCQGEAAGPISMKTISERLRIHPSLLSRIAREMERLKLIRRERIKDRRGVFVQPTEYGQQVTTGGRTGPEHVSSNL